MLKNLNKFSLNKKKSVTMLTRTEPPKNEAIKFLRICFEYFSQILEFGILWN